MRDRPTFIRLVAAILVGTLVLSVAISAGFLALGGSGLYPFSGAMPGVTVLAWLITGSIGLAIGVPAAYVLFKLGRLTRGWVLMIGTVGGAFICVVLIAAYGDHRATPARIIEWLSLILLYAGMGFAASFLASLLLFGRHKV
jgi:hypothetical protein